MMVTLSGFILNYVVTQASVHDIKVANELLEGCRQSVILAYLGYLSQELIDTLPVVLVNFCKNKLVQWVKNI
ncbi:Transposase DDE domain-containing protein [Streptococcus henryi]|uniref:Transposase DDE domain-containing protein n=1 Tax=Streptococcus henryi TaxID=439219 RepID=A0A1G6AFI3_9STRE|nr:Transposase DDE domain-containing protein [Streptococcus henryi]